MNFIKKIGLANPTNLFFANGGIYIKPLTYRHTIAACLISYVIQAVIVSFAPLLFLTFHETYHIPPDKLALLIVVNFGVQMLTDYFASCYAQKLGYRPCVLLAHSLCAMGFLALVVLPQVMPSLGGLIVAVALYAVGGGLLEVMISPIIEACPTENKSSVMSLVHSFFCWGTALTVLLSTAFFSCFGLHRWRILACLWAILPAVNIFLFSRVPLYSVTGEARDVPNAKMLFSQRIFIVFLLMMFSTGACEQTIGQWASYFAETGLGVSKTMGDLLGVCGFSVMMGLSRLWYAHKGEALHRKKSLMLFAALCTLSYLLLGFSSVPAVGLLCCALCGFAVGMFWPGVFSMAASRVKNGGTTMFALLALAGDMGCFLGPLTASTAAKAVEGNLQKGIALAVVFPLLLLGSLMFFKEN